MRHLEKEKEAQAKNNTEKYCSIEYGWSETFIVDNPRILLSFSMYAYVKWRSQVRWVIALLSGFVESTCIKNI